MIAGCIIGDPCNRWHNYGEWLEEWHLDLIRDSGARLAKFQMNIWAWYTNILLPNLNISYQDRIRQIVDWCRARNLKVVLGAGAVGCQGTAADWSWTAKAEFLVNNTHPQGITKNDWIQVLREIARLKPYAIMPFNEPPDRYHTPYTAEQLYNAYAPFIQSAILAINEESPETRCHIQSCPFWDLRPMIPNPLQGLNLVLEFHIYQQDSAVPEITSELQAGNFDLAKTMYESHIMNFQTPGITSKVGLSVQDAINAGWSVFNGECGTNTFQVEWKRYAQMHYDIMKKHDVDLTQMQLDGASAITGPDYYGMLNDAQTALNEVGLLWYQNMLTPTPPSHTWLIPLTLIFGGGLLLWWLTRRG